MNPKEVTVEAGLMNKIILSVGTGLIELWFYRYRFIRTILSNTMHFVLEPISLPTLSHGKTINVALFRVGTAKLGLRAVTVA